MWAWVVSALYYSTKRQVVRPDLETESSDFVQLIWGPHAPTVDNAIWAPGCTWNEVFCAHHTALSPFALPRHLRTRALSRTRCQATRGYRAPKPNA